MTNNTKYGKLINGDIKLHRIWFKEMTNLFGITCIYRAPRDSKEHNIHGELDSKYYEPIEVNVLFQEHPDQKSLKKAGWVAELQEGSSMIHVPYDLPHLQEGALFTVPSGIDNVPGRTFRVLHLENIMIYPASFACEIALEYEDTAVRNQVEDFSRDNFTVLSDNEEDD